MTKVSIIKCGSYEREAVQRAVRESVRLLGGIEGFVKPHQTVLVKPNLLSAKPPESCVDTHPEVVRAVCRLVTEAGATPVVGDTPGGSPKKIEDVYRASGMQQMCEEEGITLSRFKDAKMLNGFPVAAIAFTAGAIINVPKFKTHSLLTFTGAVKNMFGLVLGLAKTECHKRAPNANTFARLIVDIVSNFLPRLTVMDAVRGMEGDGPGSSGTPRDLGFIAASADPVSLDAVCGLIMGVDPMKIPVTREAARKGIGNADIAAIDCLGDSIDSVKARGFVLPRTFFSRYMPDCLLRPIASFVKFFPDVRHDMCNLCRTCVEGCPAGAITVNSRKLKFDYGKCIKCMCCHEFCPRSAIYIRENLLARMVRT